MSKKNSIAQRVLENIQEDIINGRIKDGEIITERAFEQRYQASRTPIKEALKLLEAQGWVEITPRQETRVVPFGITELQETLSIRIAMESIAAKLCIRNMNEESHAAFSRLLLELERLQGKIDTEAEDTLEIYNSLDNRFHNMLYQYSESRILRGFQNSLHALLQRTYRSITLEMSRIRDGSNELMHIIRCILNNDVLLAEAHITRHIINSIDQKIKALRTGDEKTEHGGSLP